MQACCKGGSAEKYILVTQAGAYDPEWGHMDRMRLDLAQHALGGRFIGGLVFVIAVWCALMAQQAAFAQTDVDTALVVAVDASESVDDERFRLQMEGIAQALEDPEVLDVILGGSQGGILFALVVWSDRSVIPIPWTRIGSKADALSIAAKVRKLPRTGGGFTCLARMLRNLSETLIPEARNDWSKYARIVVDVSGDGPDNCSNRPSIEGVRNQLVQADVTINGLPIITDPEELVGVTAYMAPGNSMEVRSPSRYFPEAVTLDEWYRRYVIGGGAAFMIPAYGYKDFGRAMRRKFVMEISAVMSMELELGSARGHPIQ